MKRILALLLVLVLAIGCFAGCGEDDKKKDKNDAAATATPIKDSDDASGNESDDETKKEMSFTDISETVSKFENGAEIDIKFSLAVKPVFDEYFTEEEFLGPIKDLVKKNSKGLYEIPMALSGVMNDKSAKITFKVADKNISDVIVAEEKAYVNAKAVFEFIMSLAGAGVELAWPAQGEYIELTSLLEYIQSMTQQEPNFDVEIDWSDEEIDWSDEEIEWSDEEIEWSDEEIEWSDEKIEWSDEEIDWSDEIIVEEDMFATAGLLGMIGFADMDEETKQQLITLVEVLSTAIPETTINLLANQFTELLEKNNIVTVHDDHISIKLDKNNFKGAFIAIADIVRANGADVIDYVMQAIIKSDKFDEEIKASMTNGYDKDQVKTDLQEMLNAEQIEAIADEALKLMADSHFYVTLAADDNSASFVIDVLVDGTVIESQKDSEESDFESDSMPITQVGIVFEIGCKLKDVAPITAPTNVLTEAEINTLLMLFA